MPSTADGYPWIDDPDLPADMLSWTEQAAQAAQVVLDNHEAAANPHPGYATKVELASVGVMRFANAAARTAAIPAPAEGQQTWLQDIKRMEVYVGGKWVTVAPNAIRGGMVINAWNNAPAGYQRVTSFSAPSLSGGMTVSNGTFIAPVTGTYLATTRSVRTTGAAVANAGLGYGDTSQVLLQGPIAMVQTASTATLFAQHYSDTITRNAGEAIALWIYTNAANIPLEGGGSFGVTLVNT